jgi:hypothetical protein
MEINIPSYELITRPTKNDHLSTRPISKNPPRHYTDLSFLKITSKDRAGNLINGIRESHFSFILCGTDNGRWVGISFVDKRFGDEDELEDDISPSEGVHMDPIAMGKLDADIPIWDPREYFLNILNLRLLEALKRWRFLVRTIEGCIKRYVGINLTAIIFLIHTHTFNRSENIPQRFR